jgi:hypothetical protein
MKENQKKMLAGILLAEIEVKNWFVFMSKWLDLGKISMIVCWHIAGRNLRFSAVL